MQLVNQYFRRVVLRQPAPEFDGRVQAASEAAPKVLSDGHEHRTGFCGYALWVFRKWPVVPTFLFLTFAFAILISIGRRVFESIPHDACGESALDDDLRHVAAPSLHRHMTEIRKESESAANAMAEEATAAALSLSKVSTGPPPSFVERMPRMQRLMRQRLSETDLQSLGLVDTGAPGGPEMCPSGDSSSSSCGGENATQTDPRDVIRRAHGWWLPLCKSISDEIKQQQKAPRPATAFSSLARLSGLERPFLRHMSALSVALGEVGVMQSPLLQQYQHPLQCQELRDLQRNARICMVDAMREARSLAAALTTESALVGKAFRCHSAMLTAFQTMVIDEAERDNSSAVAFALGLFWSDLGIAESDGVAPPPLFGTAQRNYGVSRFFRRLFGGSVVAWVSSGGSSHLVPVALAKAETLLELGENRGTSANASTTVESDHNATDDEKDSSRGAMRAFRLYQHAKTLAVIHHDAAAEERYLLAAEVASRNRRPRLASHSLTRLSYFLSLRGNQRRALELAELALLHAEDPLAEFLNVTLRKGLGELKDTAAVLEVERVLNKVTGQLPSQSLEEQRASALAELTLWRSVAVKVETHGVQSCFVIRDAARLLVCVVCRLLFGFDSATLDFVNYSR